MSLRTSEYRALKQRVDQLVTGTCSNAYWLGSVRDISDALSALLTELLGRARTPVGPGTGHWTCPVAGCQFSSVHPMDHPCPLTGWRVVWLPHHGVYLAFRDVDMPPGIKRPAVHGETAEETAEAIRGHQQLADEIREWIDLHEGATR